MEKAAPVTMTAQALFDEQLPLTAWETAETGADMVSALETALSGAHERMRTQFPGDLTKLNACDALFRQAHAGLSLTASALVSTEETAPVPAVTDTSAALPAVPRKRTPNVLHAAVLAALTVLFLVCAVLLRFTTAYGTVDIPVQFFTDSMLVLLGLGAVWEVLFRVSRVRTVLDEDGFGGLIYRLGRVMKWQWLTNRGLAMRKKYRSLNEWQFTLPAAAVVVKPAVPDKAALLEKCRTLLQIVDSNLPLFTAQRQAVQKTGYSPLLRALIQEYYNNRQGMSDELRATLTDQLHQNGWTLLDYSPEHEALFTTQPMSETFTIFPAIVDRDQQLIEAGFACVKEG